MLTGADLAPVSIEKLSIEQLCFYNGGLQQGVDGFPKTCDHQCSQAHTYIYKEKQQHQHCYCGFGWYQVETGFAVMAVSMIEPKPLCLSAEPL